MRTPYRDRRALLRSAVEDGGHIHVPESLEGTAETRSPRAVNWGSRGSSPSGWTGTTSPQARPELGEGEAPPDPGGGGDRVASDRVGTVRDIVPAARGARRRRARLRGARGERVHGVRPLGRRGAAETAGAGYRAGGRRAGP
jgi:hypothetical protein